MITETLQEGDEVVRHEAGLVVYSSQASFPADHLQGEAKLWLQIVMGPDDTSKKSKGQKVTEASSIYRPALNRSTQLNDVHVHKARRVYLVADRIARNSASKVSRNLLYTYLWHLYRCTLSIYIRMMVHGVKLVLGP